MSEFHLGEEDKVPGSGNWQVGQVPSKDFVGLAPGFFISLNSTYHSADRLQQMFLEPVLPAHNQLGAQIQGAQAHAAKNIECT